MTLDEIAIKHGTDKATRHTLIEGHGYTPFYEQLFAPMRHQPIRLLEIGVGGGESIRTWLEYFDKAKVVGVDCNPLSAVVSDDRYEFVVGDQGNAAFWADFANVHGGAWDIVIDDGSHVSSDVITSFNSMWRHVNYGGYYCIEDLQVSYGGPGNVWLRDGWPTHMEFIKGRLDSINMERDIESLFFSRSLAVFRKFGIPTTQ